MSGQTPNKILHVDTSGLFVRVFEPRMDTSLVMLQTGPIVRANAQAELMFGYNRQELTGQSVEIFIPEISVDSPRESEQLRCPTSHASDGAAFDLWSTQGSSEFPVAIMLNPVETADGQISQDVSKGRAQGGFTSNGHQMTGNRCQQPIAAATKCGKK